MKKYTADFETVTWLKDETYVWAWAICEIQSEEIKTGTHIEDFMNLCEELKNASVYFHNLPLNLTVNL